MNYVGGELWNKQHSGEVKMSNVETTGNALVEVKNNNIANLDPDLMKLGGMGAENVTAANVLIPRLTILQSLSPQINKKKAEFIDGAEIGDFCNVATGDIFKGSISLIPCYFTTAYIEWAKNRGGLAANHGDDASILKKCVRNDKNQNVLPNGNTVEETAQWYCLLKEGAMWGRVFFPLKATNLKHSKKWMTLVRAETLILPDNTNWKPPLFWRAWKLLAIDDSNDSGDWVTFRPEKLQTVLEIDETKQLLNDCMSFYKDVKGNVVRGEVVEDEDSRAESARPVNGPSPTDKDIPF
jgi:hypothetical protein